MRRTSLRVLICISLCTISETAPVGASADADASAAVPEVHWTLHVLYRPGGEEARLPPVAEEGAVPVRGPWRCGYKRVTVEQEDIVKIRCSHDSGAVVGTLAMCRREAGQNDLAQLSIGVEGVVPYETIDLSCSVPGDRGRAGNAYDKLK